VDAEGRLLGLNTLRLEGGLIVAIAASAELRARVERLGVGESPRRVTLGIALSPPHAARRMRRAVGLPERDGLLVRRVKEGSPADRAGLGRGDLLVAVAGTALGSVDDLFAALDGAEAALELTVVRGLDERQVSVDLEGGAS
jgi:S1-C subfamily serine protease